MVTFSAGEAELTSSFLPLFLSVCNFPTPFMGKSAGKTTRKKKRGGRKEETKERLRTRARGSATAGSALLCSRSGTRYGKKERGRYFKRRWFPKVTKKNTGTLKVNSLLWIISVWSKHNKRWLFKLTGQWEELVGGARMLQGLAYGGVFFVFFFFF